MSKSRKSHSEADDIDLATLGAALWRAKGWILGIAILAGLVAFVGLSMMRPLYTSEARILIQNEESAFTRPTTEEGRDPIRAAIDEQAVQSQVQVITSRDLIRQVVTDLDLTNNASFARDGGQTLIGRILGRFGLWRGTPESEEEKAANTLIDHLDVFQLSNSSVIAIEYTSGDPQLAAKIANKLADVYIGWQRTAKIEQTKDATAWLDEQIKALRQATVASEEAVEKFRAKEGLYSGSNNVTLNAQQLSELNSQLILAEAQKSEAQARARLIKKMLADNGDIDATPEVLKSQLIINLIEQRVEVQRQLAELSATLMPSHPRIQQLRSELTDVRAQIRAEAQKVVKSLENEAEVAAAREASLRASLNAAKSKSAGLGDAEIKLRGLEREAKANRDLLESYLARYRDASARHDMGAVPAQAAIVSRAHAAVKPSFPKRGPLTLLVMAATALLALAAVLTRTLMADAIPQTRERAEPRKRYRRPERAEPTAVPPIHAWSAPPKPAAKASPAASSSIPAARKLPVVVPAQSAKTKHETEAQEPAQSPGPAVEDTKDKDKATATAKSSAWQAKPAKRPSWLKVREPRRPRAADTQPTASSSTETSTETSADTSTQQAALAPAATGESVKPAASGFLNRLRREPKEDAGDTKSGSDESKRPGSFLDRFRNSAGTGPSGTKPAQPAPKGVEMASLSPNDLRHYLTQRIASSDVDENLAPPAPPRTGNGKVGPALKSLDAVLGRVLASTSGGLPRAVLVAGLSPKADATHAAIGIARALVDRDEQVVLVDLAKGASAVSGPLGMPRVPGFTDLAAGRVSFADVIRIDDESPLQVITAGNPTVRSEGHEPDAFMRVFEALTEAYGCVVLHADLGAISALLPALKFELPLTVAVMPKGSRAEDETEGLHAFQALGCPIVFYEGSGKPRRAGLFSRSAAV